MIVHSIWGLIFPQTIDLQDNLGSSLPLTQLAATAPAGTSTTRTTRSAANKSQTAQNNGGNMTVSFTTTKALKDNAAKKRALSSKRNQQASNAQVIF